MTSLEEMTRDIIKEKYPYIPSDLDLSNFFWYDSFFNDKFDPSDLEDEELMVLHRRIILKQLELIFLQMEDLRAQMNRKVDYLWEQWSKEVWTVVRLVDVAWQADPKGAEKIDIDRKVNEMDPDFSFRKANEQDRA